MAPRRRAVLGAAAAGLSLLAGCSSDGPDDTASGGHTVPDRSDERQIGLTHVRLSGNRVVGGRGTLDAQSDRVSYEFDGRPVWLVTVPTPSGSDWIVAGADGRVERIALAGGTVESSTSLGTRSAGAPPVARRGNGRAQLVTGPETASPLSAPVPVAGDRILSVATDGSLTVGDGEATRRADVGALPDARPVRVAPGRYAVLAGRTERYPHGALGDGLEAERVVLADVRDGLTVRTAVDLSASVVEGIAPIAADLTGDGARDLLVTLSDADSGARLAAFTAEGERLATGPGFSTGNRWRHQLCVAPFGTDGELEVAAVETPHVGGTARFYRRRGDELRTVASRSGVSSHALGSRNLDGGLAADVDGDGRPELLVPTDRRDELLALARVPDGGVEVRRRFGVGGELASNLTGVRQGDGTLAVGAAGSDGVVRIWHG